MSKSFVTMLDIAELDLKGFGTNAITERLELTKHTYYVMIGTDDYRFAREYLREKLTEARVDHLLSGVVVDGSKNESDYREVGSG